MIRYIKYTFIILFFLSGTKTFAQELLAEVRVQTPKLNTVDPSVFRTLEADLSQFINNRQWTDVNYNQNERIECTFNINIVEEVSSTRFKAEVSIQAIRPVYNSNYKTIIFQHQDKDWEFEYAAFQPMEYDPNSFINNLTSMLAYYAYVIIGYDYDSFSDQGGTDYFRLAETVVNNSQASGFSGWASNENSKRRNRYWLTENLLNPRFSGLRSLYYTYHRHGLDLMYEDTEGGMAGLMDAVTKLEQASKDNPNTMAMKVFTISKNEEIVSIFSGNDVKPTDKIRVVNMMTKVDPASASIFRKINTFQNKPNRGAAPGSRGGSRGTNSRGEGGKVPTEKRGG